MGFLKKTVILSNRQNYDKGMVVLTIEKNNSGVFGLLKAFDIDSYSDLILGISLDNEQVLKQNVVFLNGNTYSFKLKNDFDINKKIGCVLASTRDKVVVPIVWGSNDLKAEFKDDIINIIKEDYEEPQIKQVSVVSESKKTEAHEDIKPELFETTEEEVENIIDDSISIVEPDDNEFYMLIKDQIDELFSVYPAEKFLNDLIPNSKWVKVDYENNGNAYVFGLIYEGQELKYICYGVPGEYGNEPPNELKNYSQWLPLNGDEPLQKGYWIMYQDAKTGDSVIIDNVI